MAQLTIPKLFILIQNYSLKYMPNERKLSPNTIRAYCSAIRALLDFTKAQRDIPLYELTFEMLDKETILRFLDHLENDHQCSAFTRNQRLHAIQSFFKYAAREDMNAVVHWDQVRRISSAKTQEKSVGYMSEKATNIVLRQPDVSTEKGLRDSYIMLLMYKTGCRVEELANIRLFDIHFGKTPYITLHGKGDKDRNVPIRDNLVEHTKSYISMFHRAASNKSNDYLVYSVRDGEKRRMTEDNIRKLVRKYGDMAYEICPDVPQNLHPHIFRHTFAMHAYQSGIPLELLQDLLGHADLTATRIYAKADTEMKRKAIEHAFPDDGPLKPYINSEYYTIENDDMLKKLCGLI